MDAEAYITEHWVSHKVWRNLKRPKHQQRFNRLAERMPNGTTFWDVGCATGHSTVELATRVPGRWIGIDFSQTAVLGAKDNFPLMRHPGEPNGVDFVFTETATDIGSVGKADGIICSEVIEHVEDPMPLLEALARCAKQRLVVTTPAVAVNDPGHLHLFTEKTLRAVFPRHGSLAIERLGIFWFATWAPSDAKEVTK